MEEFESILEQLPEELREKISTFVSTKEQEYQSAIEAEKQQSINFHKKKDVENLKLKNQMRLLGSDPDEFILREKTVAEQIKTLSEQVEAANQREASAQYKVKTKEIESVLKSKLADELYGAEDIIENIILKGQLDILDDQIVTKEGKSLDEFITALLENKKAQRKIVQNPGVNLTPNPKGNIKTTEWTLDKINSMSPSERSQHWDEIRAYAKAMAENK